MYIANNKVIQEQKPPQGITESNIHLPLQIQCRICLQSSLVNESSNKIISPCKCTGTMKYVHQSCLEQWISKLIIKSGNKVSSGKAHIFCELCNAKIYFKTSTSLRFKTKRQMKENFCENIKNFILLMLLLIINLGFFAALLNYLLFVGFKNLMKNNFVLVSLVISGQVIFSVVAMVTFVCLFNKYLLEKEIKVHQILDRTREDTEAFQNNNGCCLPKKPNQGIQIRKQISQANLPK